MLTTDPVMAFLVLARVAGLMMTAPFFGHTNMPAQVRVALTLGLTIVLTPVVARPAVVPDSAFALGAAVLLEASLGALLGAVAQFVFAGVQLAGQLAGVQMGFGAATLMDPQSHAQVTVVAELQQLLVLLLFLILDMHHVLLAALIDSFRTAPLGAVVLGATGLREAVGLAGDVFVLGLRVGAPVMLVLLLANGAMGILARTVPQLNVFVVGFPVNVGIGLFVMGAALPFTVQVMAQRFGALDPMLGGLIQALMHG